MYTMAATKIALVFFAGMLRAEAGVGLRGELVNRDVIKERFQSELKALLGHGTSASHMRLQRLEESMRATFASMPKTPGGGIDQGTARYVLRRFFMHEHGWVIEGLSAKTDGQSSGTSAALAKSKMPSVVFELLEEQSGHHIGLQELAVVAATVEDLIFGDAMDVLTSVYNATGGADEEMMISGFLGLFLTPQIRVPAMDLKHLKRVIDRAPLMYHGWEDLLQWAKDLRQDTVAAKNPFDEESSDYASMSRFVEALVTGFGRTQDLECKAMRDTLASLEGRDRTDGKVRLSAFYSSFLDKTSQHFSESQEFLRHSGALDEMDPRRPEVVIPNYVYARSNCLSASGFFSICCINHCESLLAKLEDAVAAPGVSPERLVELVEGMPSETVAAPRQLPMALVDRLWEIAALHDGEVPLHSRLFSQWMHKAFPNECPNPADVSDKTLQAMMRANKMDASKSQMADIISLEKEEDEDRQGADEGADPTVHMGWLTEDDERMLVGAGSEQEERRGFLSRVAQLVRIGVMLAAVLSSGALAVEKLRSLRRVDTGIPLFSSKKSYAGKQHMV